MQICEHTLSRAAGLAPVWGARWSGTLMGALMALAMAIPAARAFDVKEAPPAPAEKGTLFKSVGESLRAGLRALSSGDPGSAVEPLTFAAREGNVAAQWKLGQMYREGEGVRRDDY
ncbi:MAG: hypothetical protein O9333_16855, partial [Beijerinckiaceae bacterium]|nr:hypothetical protein [Beijerinckiaceae bacterium]